MLSVVPLRYGTAFKKAFHDPDVFSGFCSDVLGVPVHFTSVAQEFSYKETLGRVKVEYDLFAEDTERRTIVELQHVRERDFFDRFLYYHLLGLIEQVRSHEDYRFHQTVYTVVVLTTLPKDRELRFDLASCDMNPVTLQGENLGVYPHKLVFVNPRGVRSTTPPALRAWLELFQDTMDAEVDESLYPDPLQRRVLEAIRSERVNPEEAARLKDEAAWEGTKKDARSEGEREGRREGKREGLEDGLREAIKDLCEAYGIVPTEMQRAQLDALGLDELEALRVTLKQTRVWPPSLLAAGSFARKAVALLVCVAF